MLKNNHFVKTGFLTAEKVGKNSRYYFFYPRTVKYCFCFKQRTRKLIKVTKTIILRSDNNGKESRDKQKLG